MRVGEACAPGPTVRVWRRFGALALQLLDALGRRAPLHHRRSLGQPACAPANAAAYAQGKVHWVDALPNTFAGVIVGNGARCHAKSVLARHGGHGTVSGTNAAWPSGGVLPGPTSRRRFAPVGSKARDYLTGSIPGRGLHRTWGDRLVRGATFFMDYGFGEVSTTTRNATWER